MSSRAQRLDALRALLDSAIAARDVAPAEVGDWAAGFLPGMGLARRPAACVPRRWQLQAAARARRGDAAARDAVLAQALDLARRAAPLTAYVYQVRAMILVRRLAFAGPAPRSSAPARRWIVRATTGERLRRKPTLECCATAPTPSAPAATMP